MVMSIMVMKIDFGKYKEFHTIYSEYLLGFIYFILLKMLNSSLTWYYSKHFKG